MSARRLSLLRLSLLGLALAALAALAPVALADDPPTASLSGGTTLWQNSSTVTLAGSGTDDGGAANLTFQHRVSRDNGATWLSPVAGANATVPSPAGIPDLALWLRADQVNASQGAPVATWADSSSNGKNATQGTAAYQPTYQQSAIGGKPAIRFDGVNDFLGNSSLSLGSQVSVFAVAKAASASASVHRRIFNNESNLFFGSFDSGFASFYGDGTTWGPTPNHGPLSALTPGTGYVLSSVNNGTDSAYMNGVRVEAGADPMSAFADGYQVGCLTMGAASCYAGSPQAWDGDIAEVIVFNRALSSAERLEVERYLLDKYGFSVPPSHRTAGEGQTLVQVRATDGIGQSSAWTPAHAGAPSSPDAAGTVRLDRTPPTNPTVTGGSTSFRNVAGLSLSVAGSTDSGGSGLSGYEYRTSTDNGSTWSAATSGATFNQSAEADTLVQFRALDNAGNASAWVGADYRGQVLSDNPIGYWRLGEGTGTAADSSGYGHNGTYVSTTSASTGALAYDTNGATTLTGGGTGTPAGAYVNVPVSPLLNDLRGGWSVDGWIKTSSAAPTYQMLIEKYDWTSGTGGFALRLNGNQLQAYNIVGQGYNVVTGATTIAAGSWHYVAAVYDPVGQTIKVYLDGALDGSAPATSAPLTSTLPLRIGAEGENTNWRMVGAADDFALYPTALSQARIQAHYAAGTARFSEFDAVRAFGATGYWRLGESSGTAATDSSGNDLSGTYAGGYTQGAAGAVVSDPDTASSFSGGYVTVPDSALLRPTTLSVQAWVKTTDTGAGKGLVAKSTGCSSAGYLIWLNYNSSSPGVPAFYIAGGGWLAASSSVADGNWHQVVGTWDGATSRIYVDGILRNSMAAPSTNTQATSPLAIGSGTPAGCGNDLTGSLDEVALFPSALSAVQVAELYGAGVGRFSRARIERTGPSTPSVSGGSLTWQPVSSVSVSAGGASAASGISGYQYRTSTDGGSSWSAAASGGSISISSQGETIVQFRSRSNANGVSAWAPGHAGAPGSPDAAGTVRIDRTAPSAPTVSGGSTTWQNTASLTVSATGSTDTGGSGLAGYQFQTSSDRGASWSSSQSGSSFTQTAEGETLVRFRALDGAGNASAWMDAYASQVAKDSPAVHYRFGETSGTSLTDASGKGATGTLAGSGMTLGQATGLFGDPTDKSLSLAGSSAYAITPNLLSTSSFPTTSTTVEVWFKANAPGDVVVELGTNAINTSWHDTQIEVLAGGVVKARFWNLTGMTLGTVSFGTWHHAAIRFDAATNAQDGFLDGVKVSGGSGTGRSTPYPPGNTLGLYYALGATDATNMGSGAYLNGAIDEFAVYPTALSDARIQAHYQAGVGPGGLIRIERSNPVAPTVSGGSLSWQSTPSVTFTASGASAPSGVANLQYRTSTNGGSSWSSATDLSPAVNTLGVGAQGETLVQFRTKSTTGLFSSWAPAHAGAPSAPDAAGTARIDRAAPSAPTVSGGSATWGSGSVNFTPSGAVDTGGSGLAGHDIRVWGPGDSTWGSPTQFSSASFSLVAEGRSRVQIRARDNAGNVSDWSPSYSTAVLADSPRAYWRLDEASGNALDSSGNGNALTYGSGASRGAGGLLTSDPDSAVTFDGTTAGQATTSTTVSGLTGTNASLETWVRIPALPAKGAFVKVGSGGGWGVGVGDINFDTSGTQLLGLYEAVSWIATGYTFPAPGTYHVVMTVDGSSTARFYVNGTLVATRSGLPSPGLPTGGAGVGGYAGTRNFTGTVDETAVYASALSAGQVSAHYAAGSTASNVASIDNGPPSAPSVTGGSTSWQNVASVTVSASGSTDAGAGLQDYQYRTSTDGGATWSSPAVGSSIAISSEGETLVQFRARDVLGNASSWTPSHAGAPAAPDAAGLVRIDRSSPAAPQVTGGSMTWTNQPVAFTASGSDPGGILRYEYRVSSDDGSTWGTVQSGAQATVSAEGVRWVQFRILDRSGKTSPWTWATPDQVRQLSPVIYYRLGESSGPAAIDHSGTGRDGTYSGTFGPPQAGPPVIPDGDLAHSFDGTSDYLAAPSINTFSAGSFSISAWIKPASLGSTQTILNARGSDVTGRSLSLSVLASGAVRFDFFNSALDTPAGAAGAGFWTHVVATYDTATGARRIYINGAQAAAGTTAAFTGVAPVVNIGRYASGTNYFGGLIDELAVHQVALSSTQAAALSAAGPAFAPGTARIDLTAPAVPALPSGSGIWSNQPSVPVGVSAVADPTGSGYAATEYRTSTDGGSTWSSPTTGLVATISAEGRTLVQFRAADNAGNRSAWSSSYEVLLDRTAPEVPTVSGGSNQWQDVPSISFSASAAPGAGAEISGYQSRTSTDGGTTWSSAAAGAIRAVSAEGQTRVQFRAIDGAGNTSDWAPDQATSASTAKIDRSAPVGMQLSGGSDDYLLVPSVTVSAADASDAYSGFSNYEHRVSTDGGSSFGPVEAGASVIVSDEGHTVVQFRAVDNIGNRSAWVDAPVKLDNVKPVLTAPTFTPGPGSEQDLHRGGSTIWFRADRAGSLLVDADNGGASNGGYPGGVTTNWPSGGGVSVSDASFSGATLSWGAGASGAGAPQLVATDAAGLQSDPVAGFSLAPDGSAPELSLCLTSTSAGCGSSVSYYTETSNPFQIDWTASDGESGLAVADSGFPGQPARPNTIILERRVEVSDGQTCLPLDQWNDSWVTVPADAGDAATVTGPDNGSASGSITESDVTTDSSGGPRCFQWRLTARDAVGHEAQVASGPVRVVRPSPVTALPPRRPDGTSASGSIGVFPSGNLTLGADAGLNQPDALNQISAGTYSNYFGGSGESQDCAGDPGEYFCGQPWGTIDLLSGASLTIGSQQLDDDGQTDALQSLRDAQMYVRAVRGFGGVAAPALRSPDLESAIAPGTPWRTEASERPASSLASGGVLHGDFIVDGDLNLPAGKRLTITGSLVVLGNLVVDPGATLTITKSGRQWRRPGLVVASPDAGQSSLDVAGIVNVDGLLWAERAAVQGGASLAVNGAALFGVLDGTPKPGETSFTQSGSLIIQWNRQVLGLRGLGGPQGSGLGGVRVEGITTVSGG